MKKTSVEENRAKRSYPEKNYSRSKRSFPERSRERRAPFSYQRQRYRSPSKSENKKQVGHPPAFMNAPPPLVNALPPAFMNAPPPPLINENESFLAPLRSLFSLAPPPTPPPVEDVFISRLVMHLEGRGENPEELLCDSPEVHATVCVPALQAFRFFPTAQQRAAVERFGFLHCDYVKREPPYQAFREYVAASCAMALMDEGTGFFRCRTCQKYLTAMYFAPERNNGALFHTVAEEVEGHCKHTNTSKVLLPGCVRCGESCALVMAGDDIAAHQDWHFKRNSERCLEEKPSRGWFRKIDAWRTKECLGAIVTKTQMPHQQQHLPQRFDAEGSLLPNYEERAIDKPAPVDCRFCAKKLQETKIRGPRKHYCETCCPEPESCTSCHREFVLVVDDQTRDTFLMGALYSGDLKFSPPCHWLCAPCATFWKPVGPSSSPV